MQPCSATSRTRVSGKRTTCLYRAPGPQGRFQKCVASTKVGKRVLVEMVQSRKKVTVPRDDIQPYHNDLDGALVADEQNIIGQIWQAKPLPPSDWTTGLAARALRGVDMRRPGAT